MSCARGCKFDFTTICPASLIRLFILASTVSLMVIPWILCISPIEVLFSYANSSRAFYVIRSIHKVSLRTRHLKRYTTHTPQNVGCILRKQYRTISMNGSIINTTLRMHPFPLYPFCEIAFPHVKCRVTDTWYS